jgi:hypothetical protein
MREKRLKQKRFIWLIAAFFIYLSVAFAQGQLVKEKELEKLGFLEPKIEVGEESQLPILHYGIKIKYQSTLPAHQAFVDIRLAKFNQQQDAEKAYARQKKVNQESYQYQQIEELAIGNQAHLALLSQNQLAPDKALVFFQTNWFVFIYTYDPSITSEKLVNLGKLLAKKIKKIN